MYGERKLRPKLFGFLTLLCFYCVWVSVHVLVCVCRVWSVNDVILHFMVIKVLIVK